MVHDGRRRSWRFKGSPVQKSSKPRRNEWSPVTRKLRELNSQARTLCHYQSELLVHLRVLEPIKKRSPATRDAHARDSSIALAALLECKFKRIHSLVDKLNPKDRAIVLNALKRADAVPLFINVPTNIP